MKDFVCGLKVVKPIREWIKDRKDAEGECSPCLIKPLASHYLGVLEEAGKTKLAKELKNAYKGGDLLTICETLDNIKGEVGKPTRKELEDLDCFVQTFNLEDDSANSR